MNLLACPREREVNQAMQLGSWPEACAEELRTHVQRCRACGDLVAVMKAFQGARTESAVAASPGPPGVLWWRAQLRRRKSAVESIGKPILGAQIFALAITLAIGAVFAGSQARHGLQWLSWLAQVPQSRSFHLESLWPAALLAPPGGLMLPSLALAGLALLGGLAVYLSIERQ
jgi:hypothetical protein